MDAFYINLDSRTDRREQFERECVKMGIQVERFPAIVRTPGALGCAHSHRAVLQLARSRGYPSVIIFEDDFECLVSRDEFDDILASLPEDYDVVMLSYQLERHEPYNAKFGRVLEATMGSGYIVSSRIYDRLLETWDSSIELYEQDPHCHWLYINDQSWKPLQPVSRWYYSVVRVGKQRAGWSDLRERFIDYDN